MSPHKRRSTRRPDSPVSPVKVDPSIHSNASISPPPPKPGKIHKRLLAWILFFTVSLALGIGATSNRAELRFPGPLPDLSEIFALERLSRMRNFTETQLNVLRDAISDRVSEFAVLREDEPFIPHPELNLTRKHPVLMIPGFITSALEMWQGERCMSDHFRKRIWGSTTMLRLILRDPACWLRHMLLSEEGRDPEGVRLRPASGLEAGDFFVGQFFVWGRIIEELGRIGYDKNSMDLLAYDWRLHLIDLEVRDRYLSRLADAIDQQYKIHKQKILIITHSYGAMVLHFFIQWASHHLEKNFIQDRIEFVYHVGGAFLGVSKAVSALLAGEMKDSDLGAFQPVLDAVMNAEERARLWRSWGSLYSMLPKGGSEVFNNTKFTVDGEHKSLEEIYKIMHMKIPGFGEKMRLVHEGSELKEGEKKTEDDWICRDKEIGTSCYRRSWTSVLRSPLPKAEGLKIFCVYGKSIPTESSYHFVTGQDGNLKIDVNVHNELDDTVRGIRRTDGDGSVAMESLSYTCEKAWTRKELNPHGVEVKARAIPHDKEPNIFSRVVLGYSGKVESSEHVDILGHHSVLEDVVALAAGRQDLVNEN